MPNSVAIVTQLVSYSLTLTVGKSTALNVGNADSEFNFPVSGKLLYNGEPVADK